MKAYTLSLEGYNETQIALALNVSQSQISIDLAIVARRNVKWYNDNARIKDRLEHYFKENRDRFLHILNQAYDLYHSPENKNKLGALTLAKSTAIALAEMGGVPDFQVQGFVDEIENLRKQWDELKQHSKVKPIAIEQATPEAS